MSKSATPLAQSNAPGSPGPPSLYFSVYSSLFPLPLSPPLFLQAGNSTSSLLSSPSHPLFSMAARAAGAAAGERSGPPAASHHELCRRRPRSPADPVGAARSSGGQIQPRRAKIQQQAGGRPGAWRVARRRRPAGHQCASSVHGCRTRRPASQLFYFFILFVGAGDRLTRPYKSIFRDGQWCYPPLEIGL